MCIRNLFNNVSSRIPSYVKKAGVLLLVLYVFPEIVEAQCAMCRAVLESGEDQEVAEGINKGIIYLMAIPYLVVATIGYFVFKTMRSKRS
ncbi:hypothetical protein [Ascidiimonas aurantiaca]|uniref:hypothetical protein n=1 Tax=Ascidiimonas aurantiaca TaxID=1685432 RepID=UPI0030EE7CF9